MDKKTPILHLRDFPSTVAMLEELQAMVEILKQEPEKGFKVESVETQVERSSAYAILHYSVA